MDLKGIDSFKGINKRVDDAELADGESPDSSNAYYPNNKLQSLGPRKGKRFFNSTAYAGAVRGIIPFRVTGMTPEIVLGLNDGSLRPVDAPFAYPLIGAPTNQRVIELDGTPTVSAVYPDTDENGFSWAPVSPNSPIAVGDTILVPRPTYGTTSWAESAGVSSVTLDLRFLLQATSGVQDTSFGTMVLTRENLGGTAGQAAGTPAGAPGNYGQSYIPVVSTVSGVIELVGIGLDVIYANTASGTFTVSYSDDHIIRISGQIT